MTQFNLDDYSSVANSPVDTNDLLNTVLDFSDIAIELPDGRYNGYVATAKAQVSNSGNPMIGIQLVVRQGDEFDGLSRWDNLTFTETAIRIVARKIKALIGENMPVATPLQIADMLVDKPCSFVVKTERQQDGTMLQRVKGIYPLTKPIDSDFDFNL